MSLSYHSVKFLGRRLKDYESFFDLQFSSLTDTRILDVGAGPASFAAEAAALRLQVTAVDPLYRHRVDALSLLALSDLEQVMRKVRTHGTRFMLEHEEDICDLERKRLCASSAFLKDYTHGRAHGRYVAAELPSLPFEDKSQDLVLCAHLLFLYANLFSADFHKAAIRELCRVASEEVRIYPLVDCDGHKPDYLEPFLSNGISGEFSYQIKTLNYEVLEGANEMLVLRRR